MASINQPDAIVPIASDLTAALSSEERYRRLLGALRRVIPYDAAALLKPEEWELLPIVAEGLSADAMCGRFPFKEHPPLEIICRVASWMGRLREVHPEGAAP